MWCPICESKTSCAVGGKSSVSQVSPCGTLLITHHTKAAEKEMVTYKLLPYNYRIYFYKCESVPGKRLIKLQKISVSICFKYVCVMAEIWLSSQTLTYLLIFNIIVLFIIWRFHAIHPGHTYCQCLPGQLSHPCPFPLKEEKNI